MIFFYVYVLDCDVNVKFIWLGDLLFLVEVLVMDVDGDFGDCCDFVCQFF